MPLSDHTIVLPSKPKVVREEDFTGVYEIDGFYPGYGHTIGNSLRRIILSSLEGAAVTSVKIDGVSHEFATIDGIKEDVITILLNLKRVHFRVSTSDPVRVTLNAKGKKEVTAGDIETPSQAEVLNPEAPICTLADSNASISMEIEVQQGLGYVPREAIQEERADIGSIFLDASFTPIRRVNYEVENMRVGNRTDFNRLRIFIETDGTVTPREALEESIQIMISQLRSIVGFREEEAEAEEGESAEAAPEIDATTSDSRGERRAEEEAEFLKTRLEDLDISPRTMNALATASIRTVGGLVRKKEEDILAIEGLGQKGLQEVKRALSNFGITLRS